MNTRLQEKIDQYHAGRLSSDEMSVLEKELASDPSLQAESNFQSDIINGLKEFRKSELKSRLNGIEVNPAWFDFIQQSTLLKSFGGVAVATLIGTGVFFLAEPQDEIENESIVIDAPEETIQKFVWNIKPAAISEESKTDELVTTLKTFKEVNEELFEADKKTPKEIAKEGSFAPNFRAPAAKDIKDEEALEISSLDKLPESNTSEVEKKAIDVDHEITKELDVKYKYYDGKLFLSGDFDRAPYEILEINSSDGRRIYVKYLDKFYKVGITDKLSALPEVKDVTVIKELNLLRENK